jgi:hypothetical protein
VAAKEPQECRETARWREQKRDASFTFVIDVGIRRPTVERKQVEPICCPTRRHLFMRGSMRALDSHFPHPCAKLCVQIIQPGRLTHIVFSRSIRLLSLENNLSILQGNFSLIAAQFEVSPTFDLKTVHFPAPSCIEQ